MIIGDRIRYYRELQGVSQEVLGKAVGGNADTIQKYELGYGDPEIEELKKIAKELGISVIEFFDIEIKNEKDLIAILKKVSPFFKWDGLIKVLSGEE